MTSAARQIDQDKATTARRRAGKSRHNIKNGAISPSDADIKEPPAQMPPPPLADPLLVFRERASARAHLVSCGYMDLIEAVDGLQEAAAAQGLLKQYGQDEIQRILSESFARWRYDG
jgi:hypothetical protein